LADHSKSTSSTYGKFLSCSEKPTLNSTPENVSFCKKKYLGHIVSPQGKSTDPEKLKAVREWPTPKNKHEIRSFLCLCTYYRRFISGFTNIAKPLTILTEQKQEFQWTPEVEAAC
jgi:hypothetical protein